MGIYRVESEAHPLTWQGWEAAKSMSACFGAFSSVGVCLTAPMLPRFLPAPPERLVLAEQPAYVHLAVLCLEPQGGCVRLGCDRLGPEPWERREGATLQPRSPIRLSASLFPKEISLTVPSSWQAKGEGVEEQGRGVCVWESERRGMLLPLWATGKSNKIELMGVWGFRGQRVSFAGRHWWVVVVVEIRLELDPLSI